MRSLSFFCSDLSASAIFNSWKQKFGKLFRFSDIQPSRRSCFSLLKTDCETSKYYILCAEFTKLMGRLAENPFLIL